MQYSRLGFFRIAGLAILLTWISAGCSSVPERPNILFIFADDHAYQSISAYGSQVNRTPNIDRLADEGMLFDRCYVTNSICAPSRAVIQTGKYSHKNGVLDNAMVFDGTQQTFPKILQQNGYQTAIVGKWHLKSEPVGFDYHEVLPGQGLYYNPRMLKMWKEVDHVGYTTEIITGLALDWLQNQRDKSKPFMLMLQHKAPHRSWEPAPDKLSQYDDQEMWEPPTLFDDYAGRGTAAHTQDMSIEKTMNDRDLKLEFPKNLNDEQRAQWEAAYGPKNAAFRSLNLAGRDLVRWKYQRYIKDYLRCISSVDDNVGRVLDYLDTSGLAENTVVIYNSDQGFYLGEHGWFDKRFMYEESYKTPLLVRWPGVITPGSRNKDIVSNVDLAETFLDLAGIEVPADMQGRSFKSLLEGQTPADWRKYHYYHYYEFPAVHSVRRHEGVADGRYKLIHFYDIGEWELFDRENDPQELTSVYDNPQYADVVATLKQELARLKTELEVPEPEPLKADK